MTGFRQRAIPFVALTLGAVLLSGGSARAAGVHILSSWGPEASGRGLAFTAKADSTEAFYHNPAGLAQLKGYQIGLGFQLGVNDVTFDRMDGVYEACPEEGECLPLDERKVDDQSYDSASTHSVREAPMIHFVTDLNGALPFTIGLGVIDPNADRTRDYGKNSAARYMIQDNELIQFNYEMGIGYTLPVWENRISLGATFGGSYVTQSQNLTASADGNGMEDPSMDSTVHFEAGDSFTPSYMLGLLVNATDTITVGASYRGKTKSDAEGTGSFTPPANPNLEGQPQIIKTVLPLLGTDPVVFDVTLPVRLPEVYRLGVRYHQPRWDVELDWIYSRYSYFGDIEFELSNVKATNPGNKLTEQEFSERQNWVNALAGALTAEPLKVPKGFKDVSAIALGGSCKIGEAWTARSGVNYQQGASGKKVIDAIFPDMDIIAVGMGGEYDLGSNIVFNLAAVYLYNRSIETKESQFKTLHLTAGVVPMPVDRKSLETMVGNGKYSAINYEVDAGVTLKY